MQRASFTISCTGSAPHVIPCTVCPPSMLKIFPPKLEPSLPGGPLSPAYEIKEAPGKGRGLFAKRDIEMGEAIVVERPMLVFPQMMHMRKSGLDTDVHNFLMMQLVQGLTNEDKSLLFTLNNCRPWHQNPVGAILSNAITITLPGNLVHHHAGLFPTISMVNHRYVYPCCPMLLDPVDTMICLRKLRA
jgi:hypothetical protein